MQKQKQSLNTKVKQKGKKEGKGAFHEHFDFPQTSSSQLVRVMTQITSVRPDIPLGGQPAGRETHTTTPLHLLAFEVFNSGINPHLLMVFKTSFFLLLLLLLIW